MKERFKKICIDCNKSIMSALQQMDDSGYKLLIVIKNDTFHNIVSIGDLQRAIIRGVELDQPISSVLRQDTTVASVLDDKEKVKEQMRKRKNEFMPVLDEKGGIADVIFWNDLFTEKQQTIKKKFNLPVVIMAGGQGTRLRPLTNVLPKPLIPIGEQTMVEDIMDRFVECGCDRFYMSVNYKADFIRQYFKTQAKKNYNLTFFQETKPLGTAGSLNLLANQIDSTFFVSNCDMIIDQDYSEILRYHQENHNEITIVAAIKSINVPYGTLETKEEGLLESIKEKPIYTFKINTGMYILEPHLLTEIPKDEFYHITFLIEKLCLENRRVGVYPINDGAWTDVGNWDEYINNFSQK